MLPKLFAAPVASQNKLGLGLLLAQTIVQTYGGNIRVASTGPAGTKIVILLPKELREFARLGLPKTHGEAGSPFEYERLYNELRKAYEELKELDKKKTEFLSTVSHELRTPLTSVQSCIENLLSGMYGALSERQQSRLDIALAGAREESRLIANLLDLARIQEGKTILELGRGSVCRIIHDVVDVFKYDAAQKNILLVENFPQRDMLEIDLDIGKIKQVVTNLISNVLKFTLDGGTIAIDAERLGDQVEIRVKDSGVGIPKEEFVKIFDRFYQVDSSLTRKVGGTGIGLNIAKEYVEMHSGRIWVESEVGQGSTFVFTLPLAKTD